MLKKQNRGKNSKAVAPQRTRIPYIDRAYLAAFFGLPVKSLIFAIVETSDGEGGVNINPVIAVLGRQEFISLSRGEIKTTARIQGLKQDLYPAIVFYNAENDEFKFKSSVGSSTSISGSQLAEHFGKSVICR